MIGVDKVLSGRNKIKIANPGPFCCGRAFRYRGGRLPVYLAGGFLIICLNLSSAWAQAGRAEMAVIPVGKVDMVENIDARVDALFERLKGPNAFPAARELGTIKDPRVVDRLIKFLDASQDEDLRSMVIDALGDIGDPRAVDILVRMLLDKAGSLPVPEKPVHVSDGVASISLEELSGGPVSLRRQSAAQALGKIKDERAVVPLSQMLQDDNYAVAMDAVNSLAEIKSSRAVDSLIAALGSPQSAVRMQAVFALGDIKDERAILPLIKVWEEDPDKYIRGQAFNALNDFSFTGRPELAARLGKGLINLYRSGDHRDQVLSVWFLGQLRLPSAIEIMLDASARPEADLREAAAVGLGNIRDPKTAVTLKTLAEDPNETVRAAARKALGQGNALQ